MCRHACDVCHCDKQRLASTNYSEHAKAIVWITLEASKMYVCLPSWDMFIY